MPMRLTLLLLLMALLPGAFSQALRPFHWQGDFRRGEASFFRNDSTPNPRRARSVAAIAGGGYALSMTYLSLNWYAQEDLGKFRFFDDSGEWLQFDKAGHMLGGYQASRWMIGLYKWSGIEKRKALLRGGLAGFMMMNSIEVLDGFGEAWGFSWSDVAANSLGSALAVANQAAWNEDRIQLKVSWRPSPYARVDSLQYLFGSTPVEWVLKDYNGLNLWLSFRVHSFLPEGGLKDRYPRWLNLAFGYGGEGMIGGYGRAPRDLIRAREYRQYYLSLDLDLTQIRTRSGFLHSFLQTFGFIRIPLPALRFDRTGLALRAFE